MPSNRIPKSLGWCLGLSSVSPETSPETSPEASRRLRPNAAYRESLAGETRAVSNRPRGARLQPGAAPGALPEPNSGLNSGPNSGSIPRPSRLTGTAMAVDWRANAGAGADGSAPSRHATLNPIRCWGHDDPAPDWASPAGAQDWADRYEVNTSTLIRVGDECTRYGLIELGGHRFIVGPMASPAEVAVLARVLKANPQIGAIFSVEPGTMQMPCESSDSGHSRIASSQSRQSGGPVRSGYKERPIRDYIDGVARRGGHHRGAASRVSVDGDLSQVQFMEFEGMEQRNANIEAATLWRSGRGVADFMRQHPGKIALVCSERGISRPCAVVASAALQLQSGDTRLRNELAQRVIEQRSAASDCHIDAASHGFNLVAELARLIAMLRAPGRGEPRWERKVHLLREHLPELGEGGQGTEGERGRNADVDWQSDAGRLRMAGLLEANFERVAPLLASGGLPPGTALLWLGDGVNVLSGVRFLSRDYTDGHIDRISQESIDPQSPDAVRLVVFDDYGLTCDNKYYDVTSAAAWHRKCVQDARAMSNPISRAPVVALLVQSSEKARLDRLLRASSE